MFAIAGFCGLLVLLANGQPDPVSVAVALAFFVFGLLGQSAYAAIFLMEANFVTRMSHAAGFSLWVMAMLLVLWWYDGSFTEWGILGLIALSMAAIPVSYFTYKSDENTDALVDRSALARGTPAIDDMRWVMALSVFGVAAIYSFYLAPSVNPLFLAFWALFGCALLAPTLDIERPRWMLQLRDVTLLLVGFGCAYLAINPPV
jgi:hypothetical protein